MPSILAGVNQVIMLSLDSDKLYSLENAMFNSGKTVDYEGAVAKWAKEHQAYVDSLTTAPAGS